MTTSNYLKTKHTKQVNIMPNQWRNRWGAECPPETSDREYFADLLGKKRQGKKRKRGENGEEKKGNCKEEGGKLKMEGGKVSK